jgi:hypothetical protein
MHVHDCSFKRLELLFLCRTSTCAGCNRGTKNWRAPSQRTCAAKRLNVRILSGPKDSCCAGHSAGCEFSRDARVTHVSVRGPSRWAPVGTRVMRSPCVLFRKESIAVSLAVKQCLKGTRKRPRKNEAAPQASFGLSLRRGSHVAVVDGNGGERVPFNRPQTRGG